MLVHVCRAKARSSSPPRLRIFDSAEESCPGKGRPGRVAIPAVVEITKRLKPGRLQGGVRRVSPLLIVIKPEFPKTVPDCPLRSFEIADTPFGTHPQTCDV